MSGELVPSWSRVNFTRKFLKLVRLWYYGDRCTAATKEQRIIRLHDWSRPSLNRKSIFYRNVYVSIPREMLPSSSRSFETWFPREPSMRMKYAFATRRHVTSFLRSLSSTTDWFSQIVAHKKKNKTKREKISRSLNTRSFE